MGPAAERQYVNNCPATASNTAGTGVTILASTTTAASAAIPDALFDRYVDFQAVGDDIWVSFGPSDMAVVDKSKAGGATFAAGTDDQNGEVIKNGTRLRLRLDRTLHAKVSWQSDAGAAKLIVRPSSQGRP